MRDSCRAAFYVMDRYAVTASGARFLVVSVLPGNWRPRPKDVEFQARNDWAKQGECCLVEPVVEGR